MIFTHMIDIDKTFKLTQGQGHGVKGQGQTDTLICVQLVVKHNSLIWSHLSVFYIIMISFCLSAREIKCNH